MLEALACVVLETRLLIESRCNELRFYRGFLEGLRKGTLNLDVEPNQGTESDIFWRLEACVVALEADG